MRGRLLGMAAAWPVVVATLCASPAAAFNSLPPGTSPHDRITAAAAAPLGFKDAALEALQAAVRQADLDDVTVKASGERLAVLDATLAYQPAHHCDRVPPATDADAFAATAAYVRLQGEEARQLAASGDAVRARTALGHALHALQDCYSHSDIGEKDPATQAAFLSALLGDGALPGSVRVCGFKPGEKVAEMPPGDPYPHGQFKKDSPNSTDDARAVLPDGRTKYGAARDLAVAATTQFLGNVMAGLTPGQQTLVLAQPPEEHHTPAVGVPILLAALVLVAWHGRRRTRG
jgi:hypothetical protein